MLKYVLIGVAILVIAFVVVVAIQPSEFRIERTASMQAPPEEVFHQVNELRNWEAWSPWARKDPDARASFTTPSSGASAVFGWSGNDEVGEGRMTIMESRPHEVVRLRLDFVRPYEDTATTEFRFQPDGEGTLVTWTMTGEHDFMSKAMCLFVDLDEIVGGDFEAGLASMKTIVEAEPSPDQPEPQPPPAKRSKPRPQEGEDEDAP